MNIACPTFILPPTTTTVPALTNLVVNGNFSQPVVSGYETFYPPNTTLTTAAQEIHGWTVGADSVDLMGSAYWAPMPPGSPKGSQSVDLSGSNPGSITQTVSTTAGTSYLLTWYEAGNPQGGQDIKVMDVSWDKTSRAYPAPSTKGHSLTNMGWSRKSQVVVATSAQSVLKFADATPDQSAYGAVVADVSLTAEQS
jgi:choice-of-anchor C domain-containing protein